MSRVTRVLRLPKVGFAFLVEQLRRVPGARFAGRWLTIATRLLPVAALVLLLLYMAEASPQRMTLAQLAAGELSNFQSWIIVEGDLVEEPLRDSASHQYKLTDPGAPNANLIVRSATELPTGHTTISGRIQGGRDGVPAGYTWTARLTADPTLANELPPPWTAFALAGLAILIVVARRTSYPVFYGEPPVDVPLASSPQEVTAHLPAELARERGWPRTVRGTLGFDSVGAGGAAELRLASPAAGTRLPIRLHSSYSTIDVGELAWLGREAPAMRVRATDDELTLTFANDRERDRAFATLAAAAR